MSLVGNLEDLSLGDILQIISLSQKSGVLALESDQGSGRIVLQSGLVKAACVKGRAGDLRQLLVGSGVLDPAGYDACAARARDLGESVEERLASETDLGPENLSTLIRESVEAAIFEMFSWVSGDFSFDVRSGLQPDDPQLVLPSGINAQYLAMEGVRLTDERSRDAADELDVDPDSMTARADAIQAIEVVTAAALADPLFGDDLLETDDLDGDEILDGDLFCNTQDDALGDTLGDALEEARGDSPGETTEETPTKIEPEAVESLPDEGVAPETPMTAADIVVASVVEREDAPNLEAVAAPTESAPARRQPVVLIDPDVSVLEWIKSAIEADFARVHVFQQADQGLARIRQYLIRGQLPLVLISSEAEIDPLSGIHGLADFVKRLKTQASRLVVLGLRDESDEIPLVAMPSVLDGVLRRPTRGPQRERSGAEAAGDAGAFAASLRGMLETPEAGSSAGASGAARASDLQGLRDATAKLQEASSRGEILPVVLDFGAEIFARVAILVARDDAVFAVAGRRIEALEVDPLESSSPICLQADEPGWIRDVLQTCQVCQSPPNTDADRELLTRFGGIEPGVAYLGPIESRGAVIALLYGDQGGSGLETPDTSSLEVVLKHAGMALDRAALKRALWEGEAGKS